MTTETKPKVAIVAPCHIPLSDAWVHTLNEEAKETNSQVIIVDDSDGNLGILPTEWIILDYKKQEEFLGDLYPDFARMFHKSSACRVVGHLWAKANGYDIVIGLDSDCIISKHFVRDHTQLLNTQYGSGWFNPVGYPVYPRGFPYSQRDWKIVANMGLWRNVLDINGADRKEDEPKDVRILGNTSPTSPFPFSGMNFALTRDAVSGFLFLPNFDYSYNKFRRIDDIWGGYIFQKMMRIRHEAAMVGYPVVYHDTIVDADADALEEKGMYDYENEFISRVDMCIEEMCTLTKDTSYVDCYYEFINEWVSFNNETFIELTPALIWWAKAISKYE